MAYLAGCLARTVSCLRAVVTDAERLPARNGNDVYRASLAAKRQGQFGAPGPVAEGA